MRLNASPVAPMEPRREADGPVRVAEVPEAAGQRGPGADRRSVEAGRQVQAVADRKQAGMSLFQRAHDIVRAKANKALDAAERPDEMLDLSYEDMLDQITKVKQALVSIAASRKRIELPEQQQIAGFDAQRDELNEQQQKMEQALSVLQDRVNKFRSQKEVLKAQYQA